MSRPESPLKANLSDDEMVKKLKALLIKEKRINKENTKIINDLKTDNEKKVIENNLLIGQIQRLSSSIGVLDDEDSNKLKELHDLQIQFDDLKQLNEHLKASGQQWQMNLIEMKNETDDFNMKLKSSFEIIMKENCELFTNNIVMTEVNEMCNINDYILDFIGEIRNGLRSRKESNEVLQDGLSKITMKCNQLEEIIDAKNETLESISGYQKQLLDSIFELDQKEEQIKRLEELIEDNRSISRALETERDQLQNDLVDLRQRQEEKEGYLIEEYREAQICLESYRIFTDRQSAEKANEIERLRKCINEYEQAETQEPFMTDCRLCHDVESLFDRLKTRMNIGNDSINYEEIIGMAVEKYESLINVIDSLTINETLCRQELEILTGKVEKFELWVIEKKIEEKNNFHEILEDLNKKNLEKEEKIFLMQKELEKFTIMHRNIADLLSCDDSSPIIDSINRLISLNKNLTNEIDLCKFNNDEQRNRYEQLLQEKDCYASQLNNKLLEADRNVNHSDLMNLEMAEIDKTLVSLNNQLSVKCAKIVELESSIIGKEARVEELLSETRNQQRQCQQLDERNNKMKQMLVKTKRELAEFKSQCSLLQDKEREHSTEIESLNIELDGIKVSLSESISEREKLQERYNSFSKKIDSISKNREITIASLRSQVDLTSRNYKDLQHEFEMYKVKVQTAYSTKARPPSTFSDFMTLSSREQSNDEELSLQDYKKQMTDLEMNIDELKIDLREKEEKIFSLQSDMDLTRWDHEKLSEKLKNVLKENAELSMKIQQTNEQLQNDTKLQQISHDDMLQRCNTEKEKLNTLHQKQIESMKSIYELEIENLTLKIEEKDMEKVKLQEEIWDCREQLKTADHNLGQMRSSGTDHGRISSTDIWAQQLKSPINQERQQGEGMEMIHESENINSTAYNKVLSPQQFNRKHNKIVPLDRLLSSQSDEDQRYSDELVASLRTELTGYRKKNEHLVELLNDNEGTVARLTEQATLLKTEIRRLENNQARDNTLDDQPSKEYLKNVIIKFLHYDTTVDERSHLVPVLVTLLSLDQTEKDLLTNFCKMCSYNKKDSNGWSSYFTWTGVSSLI